MMAYLRSGSELLSGSVNFKGMDLYGMTEREIEGMRGKMIALIPQNAGQSLTPTMRVGAQIGEALRLHSTMDPPRTPALCRQAAGSCPPACAR